ncbi:hypothetical protein DL765_010617 [Monosporascus sp. GIB2]|nr:hypothetical protein DL765_010617 [Monosporascus sp. GIB2]
MPTLIEEQEEKEHADSGCCNHHRHRGCPPSSSCHSWGDAGAVAVGAATLGRIIFPVSEASNAAYGIYTIVDGPDSALMGVMGLLLGAGGIAKAVRDAMRAKLRSRGDAVKLGGFKANDDKLQAIVSACMK